MQHPTWKWFALSLVLLTFSSAQLSAQTCEPQTLVYGTYVDRYGVTQDLLLDLVLPSGGTTPAPVLVWIHGGGWKSGSRTPIPARVSDLCFQGFAIASLDYRFSMTAVWPAQLHDVKGAVRWLRTNAAAYNLDPDRFGAWGESAGAHLASLLGTTGGVPSITIGSVTVDLEGSTGGNGGVSSRVQSVVDVYGATDFLQMRFYPTFTDHDSATSDESRLIGGPIQDNAERSATANPINYVTPDDPPFLVIHGTLDKVNPFNQSELLVDALRANQVPVDFLPVQNAGHGGSQYLQSGLISVIHAFLRETVRDLDLSTAGAATPESLAQGDTTSALPAVTVAATDARASETGGNGGGTFMISRDGLPSGSLAVQYSLTGTASNGADYTTLSGTATIPSGAASVAVDVTPLADDLRETYETVIVTLSPAAAYSVGSPATASVVLADVTDAARPTVSVSGADPSAAEPGSNTGTFLLWRTGSTTAALTVDVTAGGSADGLTDYSSIPATVTFPAGADRVAVTVSPLEDYTTEETEDVTLAVEPSPSIYVGPYAGSRVSVADDDVPGLPVLVSLSVAPASVLGGVNATGTVTLSTAAPAGGSVVSLSTSNTAVATVPATVTVPAGATSASFTVTSKPVASAATVTIGSSYRGVSRTASLAVQPPVLSGLSLTPTSVPGGCKTATGKVTLSGKAPTGGLVVSLTNANSAASMPSSVTVAAGATSATFTIATSTVTASQSGAITASFSGVTKSGTFQVRPVGVLTLALSPNPVVGPGTVTGTVTLECAAPAGGLSVALSSTAGTIAWPTAASLTIPAGSTTGTFSVATADVSVQSTAAIRAAAGGTQKSVQLAIQP